jgi:hypothetical protein
LRIWVISKKRKNEKKRRVLDAMEQSPAVANFECEEIGPEKKRTLQIGNRIPARKANNQAWPM